MSRGAEPDVVFTNTLHVESGGIDTSGRPMTKVVSYVLCVFILFSVSNPAVKAEGHFGQVTRQSNPSKARRGYLKQQKKQQKNYQKAQRRAKKKLNASHKVKGKY